MLTHTHTSSLNMCIVFVFEIGFLLWYRSVFDICLNIWYRPNTTAWLIERWQWHSCASTHSLVSNASVLPRIPKIIWKCSLTPSYLFHQDMISCFKTICVPLLNDMHLHFLTSIVWLLLQISIFLPLCEPSAWWWLNALVTGASFQCSFHLCTVLTIRTN